jgi:hypothetical protein
VVTVSFGERDGHLENEDSRMKPWKALASGLVGIGIAAVGLAQGVAVAPKVGTTGAGLDVTIGLSPSINLRLGGQGYTRSETRREQEIEYDADLELLSGQLLLDLHPGGRGFRLSAGVVLNANEVTAVSTERTTYTINATVYPVGLVGRLRGKVEAEKIAPYLGVGWGNAVGPGSRWRLALDVGAFYQGEPEVSLVAQPIIPILVPSEFFEDLEAERRQIEEDVSDYTVYPVVAIGVSYRF